MTSRGAAAVLCVLSLVAPIGAQACPNGQFEAFRNCLPDIDTPAGGGPTGGGWTGGGGGGLAPPAPGPPLGAYCYTETGRFGPGPVQQLGAPCAVPRSNGMMMYGAVGP